MADRDERGRLLPGHSATPGAGRPPKTTEDRYLAALSRRITEDDWLRIVERALVDATTGKGSECSSARDWISKHLVGDPSRALERLRILADETADSGISIAIIRKDPASPGP